MLITGAEEFGMVGARMFAKSDGNRLASSVAINLDTIDDQGDLYVVTPRRSRRGARRDGDTAADRCRIRSPHAAASNRHPGRQPPARPRRHACGDDRPAYVANSPTDSHDKDTSEGLSLTTATSVGRALATN